MYTFPVRFRTILFSLALACALCSALPGVSLADAPEATKKLNATLKSTYTTGVFDESAARALAYDSGTERAFVANASSNRIEILDMSTLSKPDRIDRIDLSDYGHEILDVACQGGILAATLGRQDPQNDGEVVLMNTSGTVQSSLDVGAMPVMAAFSPDGNYLLVANKGEPDDAYDDDPKGTVTIVNLSSGAAAATAIEVDFSDFNGKETNLAEKGARVFGPDASVARDLEPAYIAVSDDSYTAYVSCPVNNALAIIDLPSATVTHIFGFGFKDHGETGNGFDASDADGVVDIATHANVYGMYQPQAIAVYEKDGKTYIVAANGGESRDHGGYSEVARVADLTLDPTVFPDAATLQLDENLGRLHCTTTLGDTDDDGDYDAIYTFGARSVSFFRVRDERLEMVYDSGDAFEQVLADRYPTQFNSDNDDNDSFDSRSDDQGAEPAVLTLGTVGDKRYAFIGLKRMGGYYIYDITKKSSPKFVDYVLDRDFAGSPASGTAGDLGPSDLIFVQGSDSPNGDHLLLEANEVSGTTTTYSLKKKSSGSDDDDGNHTDDLGSCVLAPNARPSLDWALIALAWLALVVYRRAPGPDDHGRSTHRTPPHH